MPTRRTVSGAPPLSHRPAIGWARSCNLDEPTGLFPPAPRFHRTCSGEQSHWTGSGELSKMASPHQRGPGGAPGCCLLPVTLSSFLASGKAELCVWLSRLYHVACVPCVDHSRYLPHLGELHEDAEPDARLASSSTCAEPRGLPKAAPDTDAHVPPVSQGKSLHCSEIQGSARAASAPP